MSSRLKKRRLGQASVFALCLVVALQQVSTACEWDYDTLKMEQKRFPSALELITGRYLKHSREFYRWRIEDRQRKIDEGSALAGDYDDIAVAYDKLDNPEKALETILEKETLFPGMYETLANKGTFLIHAGRFEEGLEELRAAVEMNPDAHFGRERYQIRLVEYVLAKKGTTDKIPMPLDAESERGFGAVGFAKFVIDSEGWKTDSPVYGDEIKKATDGVLGMLRFGRNDSPILLEAVGDLLLADHRQDNKRLAARAYLRASWLSSDKLAKEGYETLAKSAVDLQLDRKAGHVELSMATLAKRLRIETNAGKKLHDSIRADEKKWVENGIDVERAFDKKYYVDPAAPSPGVAKKKSIVLLSALGIAVLFGLCASSLWRFTNRATMTGPKK